VINLDTLSISPGMRSSGDGWDNLDEASAALLTRVAHAPMETSTLWHRVTQLPDADGCAVLAVNFKPADVSIEGLLPARYVTRGTDGLVSFSAASDTQAHSLDNTTPWLGEDGDLITALGAWLLLPLPGARVSDTLRTTTQTWYTLPYKAPGELCSIRTQDGSLLLAGVDFVCAFGLLFFQEHPASMFPGGVFWCSSLLSSVSPTASVNGVDAPAVRGGALAVLLRKTPTTARLEFAVNATLGIVTLPQDGQLITITQLPVGVRYSFTWGDLLCEYEHDILTVGVSYTAGTQVGALVRLYERGTQGIDWWRALDWTWPVSLRWLCPADRNLEISNRSVRAEGYTLSGATCVKFYIDGTPASLQKYWSWCAQAEISADRTRMATRLSLSAGDTTDVDMLGLLFELVGPRAIVVDIKASAGDRAWVMLRRYAPTTAVFLPRFLP
jgi:hypothetical protein